MWNLEMLAALELAQGPLDFPGRTYRHPSLRPACKALGCAASFPAAGVGSLLGLLLPGTLIPFALG
jgi:hypothetical protein